MTLSGVQALGVLAVACGVFLRWGCIRDESSPSAGTAGSQGERTGGARTASGACRDCEDVR